MARGRYSSIGIPLARYCLFGLKLSNDRVDKDLLAWRIAPHDSANKPRKFKLVSSKAASLKLAGIPFFSKSKPLMS